MIHGGQASSDQLGTNNQPGMQPGMNNQPGVQPGMQPGVQPGMQPGVQPGMQPGVPTSKSWVNMTENERVKRRREEHHAYQKKMEPIRKAEQLAERLHPWFDTSTLKIKQITDEDYEFIYDNSTGPLTYVLIKFMNQQDHGIRSGLSKELYDTLRNTKNSIRLETLTYQNEPFYAVDISKLVAYNLKMDTLNLFLKVMSSFRKKYPHIKYKGISIGNPANRKKKSIFSSSENNFDSSVIKYAGMINCCIENDNNCNDEEKGFFGTRRKKDPRLCAYPSVGGTRRKRRLRSTRRLRSIRKHRR